MPTPNTKAAAYKLFSDFIAQPPQLDRGNYSTDENFQQEKNHIQKQRGYALAMLELFNACPYNPKMLSLATRSAFSGRLEFNNAGQIEYTTGQYWPTEYRLAAGVVLERYIKDAMLKLDELLNVNE
jgi:dimeric dUTPase (all-alpha-NTP-PPase superfamily)